VFCGKRAFRSLVGAIAVRVLAGTIPFRVGRKAVDQRVDGGSAEAARRGFPLEGGHLALGRLQPGAGG